MATYSSILAWRIPGTEEPGGLPSMGSQSWTQLKRLSSSSHCNGYEVIAHILICIPLRIIDLEYLFIYFLAIHISSLEKCLFKSFIHF